MSSATAWGGDHAASSPAHRADQPVFIPIVHAITLYGRDVAAFSLNARLYVLSLLILAIGMGMYNVIFNLYLVALGHSPTFIGGVLAFPSLAVAVLSLPLGLLTDRLGRGRIMIAGEAAIGLGILGPALFSAPIELYALSFWYGVGLACYEVVYGPFLTENSSPKERLQLFGFATILVFVGTAAGQMIGAFLPGMLPVWLGLADRYRLTLGIGGIVAMAAIAPLLAIWEGGHEASRPRLGDVLRDLHGVTGQFFLIYTIIGIQAGLTVSFFNLFFVEHLGASREAYGLIASLAIVPCILGPLLGPLVSRRWGMLVGGAVSRSLLGVVLLVLALAPNVGLAAAMYWLRWLLFSISVPLIAALQMELIDPKARASISGLVVIGFYLASTAGTAAAGWLIASWGYPAPYLVAAALHIVLAFTFWQLYRLHKAR